MEEYFLTWINQTATVNVDFIDYWIKISFTISIIKSPPRVSPRNQLILKVEYKHEVF